MARKKTSQAASNGPSSSIEWLATADLLFDPENPRLIEYLDGGASNQPELLRILWQHMAVDELAMSIAASGYFDYEPLFVIPHGRKFHVIEGNRRLAAVRLLIDKTARTRLLADDLPSLTKAAIKKLERLPAIRTTTRKDVWQHFAVKHVNGPAKWSSFAKARYVARVHAEFGVPLQDIADQIGDRHRTVQRLYRALMVIEQAEDTKVFSRANRHRVRFSFSHLYTGLDCEGIAKFVGLKDVAAETAEPVPKKNLRQLGELLVWLYGDKTLEKPAVVESQNPHLRQLDEVLKDSSATDALRAGLPLSLALEVSYGDEQVFMQALHRSKESLQKARGTLSTGFHGESDLSALAESIHSIASDLLDEMDRKKTPRRRPKGRR